MQQKGHKRGWADGVRRRCVLKPPQLASTPAPNNGGAGEINVDEVTLHSPR